MDFSKLKNIVFDLGGVIINLDFQRTYEAFAELANMDILQVIERLRNEQLFPQFETGKLSEAQMRNEIRRILDKPISDQEIDRAWNALLLDIPKSRIERIQSLKGKYRLFLLSNTNTTHIRKVNQILNASSGVKTLEDLFEKTFYSYDMALAKPDVAIYQKMLSEKNMVASETLFLDDSIENLYGAEKAAINTIRVTRDNDILTILAHA